MLRYRNETPIRDNAEQPQHTAFVNRPIFLVYEIPGRRKAKTLYP